MLIETDHPGLSVARQCELLDLPRSSLYYRPWRDETYNEELMRLIDEQYTRTPFYGIRKMRLWLAGQGHEVNLKRVQRLMRRLGLEAIYPKPRLSAGGPENRVYPYLLRGVRIDHSDQVWATDITYIRMRRGFLYLVAIMDWHSRYVLSWELSPNLETDFCVTCLERALEASRPAIFNSDQGAQFTSAAFTQRLEAAGVAISMDGRGRFWDNIFIERLWRSVKYEEVYLHDYEDGQQARERLEWYFPFYNHERPHQSLEYATPARLYSAGSRNTKEVLNTNQSVSVRG
jgi:putative transposase